MPEGLPDGFWHDATQFLFGLIGLALITLAAVRLNLQPGTVSLLYLIVVVFVSLRTGFVSSVAVSLVAVFCLSYFFRPLFSSLKEKNPLDIVATAAFLITAWVVTGMVARVRKLTEAQLTMRFEERLAERTRIARVWTRVDHCEEPRRRARWRDSRVERAGGRHDDRIYAAGRGGNMRTAEPQPFRARVDRGHRRNGAYPKPHEGFPLRTPDERKQTPVNRRDSRTLAHHR